MNKQFLILVIGLITLNLHAQLVLTTTGPGTVGVEYGLDFSLYDPSGDEEVYLYMWVDPAQTTPEIAMQYGDDWNDATSLVVINWSASENKFIGEIDFNTHDFIGEGVLPGGTGIDDFNLILRNEAGTAQSGNLFASDHSFAGTQTLSNYDFEAEKASYYSDGTLYLNGMSVNESIEISIFDSLGKQVFVTNMTISQNETRVELSNLESTFAVIHVQTASGKYFVKKIVL